LKAIMVIAVLCMPIAALAGCWNNRDLTDINIVTALGIDKTEDGRILLAVQIAEPAAVQAAASGKGKGGSTQAKPVIVVTHEGETVFDALRGMLAKVDKKLFLSTSQVLILGERLAEEGLFEAIDFLQRDHEVNYKMAVLVAKGAAPKEILEIETDMDPISAVYIKDTAENTVSRAKAKRTILIDLIKEMSDKGKQPVIGQITKVDEKMVNTEGAAVFKDGKLKGWLDPNETRGYLFATGKVQSTIVNIPAEDGNNGKISMEVVRSDGKAGVKFKSGEPSLLTIKVTLEANIGEYSGIEGMLSPEKLHALEHALEQEIKGEIGSVFKLAQQEFSSDIFGFGTQVHKYHLQYWKKVKDNWDDVFSRLPVDIEVDAKIRRTGIIKDPIRKGG